MALDVWTCGRDGKGGRLTAARVFAWFSWSDRAIEIFLEEGLTISRTYGSILTSRYHMKKVLDNKRNIWYSGINLKMRKTYRPCAVADLG